MANGLDKLERLFSARKKSASSRATTTEPNIAGSVLPPPPGESPSSAPPLFPQAPFIRPRCNVMYARDELDIYSPKPSILPLINGKHSLDAESSSSSSYSSSLGRDMTNPSRGPSSFSTTASFHVPKRTSSLLSRRHNRILPGFVRDTAPPIDSSSTQAMRPLPLRIHKQTQQQQTGLLEALPIYPAIASTTTRVETPPPSDQDDFHFPSPPSHVPKPPFSTVTSQLTPEPSPAIISCNSSTAPSSEYKRDSLSSSSSPSKRATASSVPLLDDDWRDSYITAASLESSRLVCGELHVKEFLSLTDDDLAESNIVSPSKPPTKRAPPPPILPPNVRTFYKNVKAAVRSRHSRSMMPQSPIIASNEVAAWEAARIAKKYDFDVVYVANFWPSGMNHLHNPQEPSTPWSGNTACVATAAPSARPPSFLPAAPATPRHSLAPSSSYNVQGELQSPVSDCCPNSAVLPRHKALTRLNGCLLAGYGLETIQAPFRLSARLHKKILRSEGWIEHRNSDAQENQFARGYAKSFYTGTVTASNTTTTTTCSLSSSNNNIDERRVSAPDSYAIGTKKNTVPRKINRGIVFVAFRRPRPHGGTVHSSQAELDALDREAETLVELILDFHEERRRWEMLQEARRCA